MLTAGEYEGDKSPGVGKILHPDEDHGPPEKDDSNHEPMIAMWPDAIWNFETDQRRGISLELSMDRKASDS